MSLRFKLNSLKANNSNLLNMTFSEKTDTKRAPLVDFSSEWCLPCMTNAEHYYEVNLEWQSDQKGKLNAPTLSRAMDVSGETRFSESSKVDWTPEHLFVAAVNSCLMTTFFSVAENAKLEFSDFNSKAIGKIETLKGISMISEITLMPVLTITNKADQQRAEILLIKSEDNCLIANSTKSKIIFKPVIKIK